MSSFYASAKFWGWVSKDGTAVSSLYDGQGPATKDMIDKVLHNPMFKRDDGAPEYPRGGWNSPDYPAYAKAHAAWHPGHRKRAKEWALRQGYRLITYKLVPDV